LIQNFEYSHSTVAVHFTAFPTIKPTVSKQQMTVLQTGDSTIREGRRQVTALILTSLIASTYHVMQSNAVYGMQHLSDNCDTCWVSNYISSVEIICCFLNHLLLFCKCFLIWLIRCQIVDMWFYLSYCFVLHSHYFRFYWLVVHLSLTSTDVCWD